MSARKIDGSGVFPACNVQARQTRLSLSPDQVRIHRNGVEFRSAHPHRAVDGNDRDPAIHRATRAGSIAPGVVVACNGNRHDGYAVSMVFTSLSKQSQARLNLLAYS